VVRSKLHLWFWEVGINLSGQVVVFRSRHNWQSSCLVLWGVWVIMYLILALMMVVVTDGGRVGRGFEPVLIVFIISMTWILGVVVRR